MGTIRGSGGLGGATLVSPLGCSRSRPEDSPPGRFMVLSWCSDRFVFCQTLSLSIILLIPHPTAHNSLMRGR